MAKALQSPAPAPQQLLAVWETSGHQRVLLGPSESWPGRPKAKINKGALLHPLPSLLCAVTCAFLKRMACSPPHPPLLGRQIVQNGLWGQTQGGAARLSGLQRCAWTGPSASLQGRRVLCVPMRVCTSTRVHACTDSARTKSVHTSTPICLCKQALKASKKHCMNVTGGGTGTRLHLLVSSA